MQYWPDRGPPPRLPRPPPVVILNPREGDVVLAQSRAQVPGHRLDLPRRHPLHQNPRHRPRWRDPRPGTRFPPHRRGLLHQRPHRGDRASKQGSCRGHLRSMRRRQSWGMLWSLWLEGIPTFSLPDPGTPPAHQFLWGGGTRSPRSPVKPRCLPAALRGPPNGGQGSPRQPADERPLLASLPSLVSPVASSVRPLQFKVLPAISNVPAHIWSTASIQEIIGSSCLVFEVAPCSASKSDMSKFMVVAWSVNPHIISAEVGCIIPEPTTPFEDRQPILCSSGYSCSRFTTSTHLRPTTMMADCPRIPVTPAGTASLLRSLVLPPWLHGRGSTVCPETVTLLGLSAAFPPIRRRWSLLAGL
jgi:hypothetical protein